MSAQAAPATVFAQRATEISEFCLKNGGQCFARWPVPTLFAYVFFHVVTRTVFCVREGGQIAGVLFAWGMPASEIEQAGAEGKGTFAWRKSRDDSDAIFLAEFIGRRDLFPRLLQQAETRWPDWRRKRIFTFRTGRLVELPQTVIAKFLRA